VSELSPDVLAALRCEPAVRTIEPNGSECTGNFEPGVVVVVYQGTSDSADATGVAGLVRDGGFVDSLRFHEGIMDGRAISLSAAGERPGYTVYVEKPGFYPWD